MLSALMSRRLPVLIYSDRFDHSSFTAGVVEEVWEDSFLVARFSALYGPEDAFAGLEMLRLDTVFGLETGCGSYLSQSTVEAALPAFEQLSTPYFGSCAAFLRFLISTREIVSVQDSNARVYLGRLTAFDEGHLLLDAFYKREPRMRGRVLLPAGSIDRLRSHASDFEPWVQLGSGSGFDNSGTSQ